MKPMLLNGRWVTRQESTPVFDPERSEPIDEVPLGNAEDVEVAVAGAKEALGRRLPSHERARILRDAAHALAERAGEAAQLIATEGIKTVTEARSEVARAVATIRLSAEAATRASGKTHNFDQYPTGAARMAFSVRQPLGIIGAITPFNDPLNLVAHKVGPALAGGNAIVLKPDSKTPLSALMLAEIFQTAGLPAGLLNVITGPGSVVGDAIVTHPAIPMISFTGGVDAGRRIHERAGLKRTGMELGANNAAIVHHDADLESAIERIGSGAFWAAGQNCLHVQRVYAHDRVFDDLVGGLMKYAESRVLGPKLDEETDMGPLIDAGAIRRTADILTDAVDAGGDVVTGGSFHGPLFEPTLVVGAASSSRAFHEEIYAPITMLVPYDGLDDAIDRANATEYGLAAAIFTRDIQTAFAAAARLDAGQVMINESTDFRIDAMPFGGSGSSGLGREGVDYAVEAMTDPKLVVFSGVEVPGLG